jgi:teichuronic acid biosynthesis glycosyltransferase TuaH
VLAKLEAKLTSLLWRFLTAYGRIKYRYLLPIYRWFGLLPNQRKADTRESNLTLRGAETLVRVLDRGLGLEQLKAGVYVEQLKAVSRRVRESKGAVVFLPSTGWDIVNAQRSHHLAREFARQGFVAIFDSSNSYDDVDGFKEIVPNLYLFRGSKQLLRDIADPVLWTLPYNFDQRDSYPSKTRTVYDWIDDFAVFNFERGVLERNHERALKEATVVASVAQRLHQQAAIVRPDALYLPNGVDYEHFAKEPRPVPEDAEIGDSWRGERPIAGYYGAMAEWFDYELLDTVSGLRADWNFLLIGPPIDNSIRERGKFITRRQNIRWIGQRDYATIPGYLQSFDVAMIPFRITDITQATSPLKLYEYFAGGKPVVTTPMMECQSFPEVQIAQSAEEFSRALDRSRVLGQDPGFREQLRKLGRENSWTARVHQVLAQLQTRAS